MGVMDLKPPSVMDSSWQERYQASVISTLRCRLSDYPGILGVLTTAIGRAGANVGNIRILGVDGPYKLRDVTIYCSDSNHLNAVLKVLNETKDIEVLEVRDDILDAHLRGVIEVQSRVPINDLNDLRMLYTPGVASVCHRIEENLSEAWQLTGLCDRVAIVTNGTAVLGLGEIGVVASLPVMEGKAAIFSAFGNIGAFPILIDTKDVDEFVETVCRIAKSFGAIQLEDVSAPSCFSIEDKLKAHLDIPVCHDDQHGTATVVLAGLIKALEMTKRRPESCSALVLGAGAAGYAITQMLLEFGIGKVVIYDSGGLIYPGRKKGMNRYKQLLGELTNPGNHAESLAEGFRGKDIFIGVAKPNTVTQEMISFMAENPIVFPLSNPVGEISISQARQAGAAVTANGRQINNALAYPGLFRGALDARAKDITLQMQLAAARKLASLAKPDNLLPDMLDRDVHRQVADAVAEAWSVKNCK